MMGRRPKGLAKNIPVSLNGVTDKQADLLMWVYTAGYIDPDRSEVVWSAKEYLGRSPTGSEAATLTKRLQTLVGYDLVERRGRTLLLSEEGRWALYSYAIGSPKSRKKQMLLARLERDKAARELRACSEFFLAAAHLRLGEDKLRAIHEAIEPVVLALKEKQHLADLKLEEAAMVEGNRNSLFAKKE